jgi:hypothetical protein
MYTDRMQYDEHEHEHEPRVEDRNGPTSPMSPTFSSSSSEKRQSSAHHGGYRPSPKNRVHSGEYPSQYEEPQFNDCPTRTRRLQTCSLGPDVQRSVPGLIVGLETCQLSEPDLAKQHDGIARTYGFELSETVLRADSTSRCSCSNGLRRIRTVQPDGELRVETVLNTLAAPQVDYHRSKLPSRRRRRRRRRRHNLLAASVSLSHLCRLYPVLTVLRYATLGP